MSRRRGRHRPKPKPAQPIDRVAVERGADAAFALGEAVVVGRVVVVPDVVVVAAVAAGLPHPKTWRVVRDDGRWAEVYKAPAVRS